VRAVVFAGDGRVRVDDVARPEIAEAGDAIVKVTLSAICGSDLHLLDGKTPGMREGSVIGHEFLGTIESLGTGVRGHDEGTRVLGSFLIACGTCASCAARRFNFCKNRRALGLGPLTGDLDGAQAEYVRVPNADVNLKNLTGALSGLTNEEALFGGDVLATGFYAATVSEAANGDTVAVIGAGPIGLLTAVALRRRGANVVVIDIDQARADFAAGLGFTSFATDDASAAVAQATDGAMADVAVDAVGQVPALKAAVRCVREGGRVVVVGVYGTERYELPMGRAWLSGLDLRFAGMANVQAEWDGALLAVAKGDVDPTRLISHRMPLEEAERGYEMFAQREATKVVLSP